MADYQLWKDDTQVQRTADRAYIPNAPGNRDWDEYQRWLEVEGNIPDPYEPPPEPPPGPLTPEQSVLYDHENRIRGLEGVPPLTLDDFKEVFKGGPPAV